MAHFEIQDTKLRPPLPNMHCSAEIHAWPLASVVHFNAAGLQIPATHAAAALCAYAPMDEAAKEIVVSLLANASTAVKTMQHRLAIAGRACKGVYDDADPDQESPALVAKLGFFESQMDQLEPFLTSIVEANEQARMKIQAQALEKAELSAQLAQANQLISQLTRQLSAHAAVDMTAVKAYSSAADCLDVPQEMVEALSIQAAVVSSPVESAEEDESEDDASLAGDEDQADEDLVQDDFVDMEAFQQYVLLEDEATMEWSQDQQAANASAFSILSDAITSDMVGCGLGGICLLPMETAERSPKLVAHIEANKGLLLVGASEDVIAKLPLEWFAAIDTCKLSLLERRAINMALLAPALMFWLPQFHVCPESAQKYMWFRQHLDSLMELTEEDDSTAPDADYLAVAAASAKACPTQDDDSDVSTASEDEDAGHETVNMNSANGL